MLNPAARAVRGAVKLNDEIISGWKGLEVDNNSYASADTFTVSFAAARLPSDRNLDWLSRQKDAFVELFVGFPPNPLQYTANDIKSWIYGQVDKITYSPDQGRVELSGRDLTRVFIDNKTTEKWQNKTSSQIATILAQRHGLSSSVTSTTTPVGKFYEIDHEEINASRTEWDLLCYLARSEGFVVYVRGKTLYFEPPTPTTATPYKIVWTPPDALTGFSRGNVQDLSFERSLTVSRGVIVTVRTFNDAMQKVFTATYPPSAPKVATPGKAGVGAQVYYYTIHNSTQQGVVQEAKQRYDSIIQHEMVMSCSLPGDDTLDTTSLVSLSGTGTAWDQLYYPDSITRSLNLDTGYGMHLSAKNHNPDSQADE